jgi:hypothetical protein
MQGAAIKINYISSKYILRRADLCGLSPEYFPVRFFSYSVEQKSTLLAESP